MEYSDALKILERENIDLDEFETSEEYKAMCFRSIFNNIYKDLVGFPVTIDGNVEHIKERDGLPEKAVPQDTDDRISQTMILTAVFDGIVLENIYLTLSDTFVQEQGRYMGVKPRNFLFVFALCKSDRHRCASMILFRISSSAGQKV